MRCDADRSDWKRNGMGISCRIYRVTVNWYADSGWNCDVGNYTLADSVLSVPEPENGNISDAFDPRRILHGYIYDRFFEVMVCTVPRSNYRTVDVSDTGSLTERSDIAAGADDLFSGACRDEQFTDRNSGSADLVLFVLVGKQKMV